MGLSAVATEEGLVHVEPLGLGRLVAVDDFLVLRRTVVKHRLLALAI